jgi:hypothetical protein
MERGCKTGSFSYLLWPSRVGAFTAVIGKHYANFDTADFPFSYINEDGGKSVLVPAMNFFTVGTLRDGRKWPARDRRTSADKLDLITFDVLSPFTGQKMRRAVETLGELQAGADRSQEYVSYRGVRIKRLLIKTCSRYYGLALSKYYGDALVRRAQNNPDTPLSKLLVPCDNGYDGAGEWVDVFGLLCPKSRIDTVCSDIVSGTIADQPSLLTALQVVHATYRDDEWNWVLRATGALSADDPAQVAAALLQDWQTSSTKLIHMVLNDAEKEFEGTVRTGFGIDGNADADFEAVRGTFSGNSFVRGLHDEIAAIDKTYTELTTRVS